MAIAFGTAGSEINGTTLFNMPYPASISAGDLLTLYYAGKYPLSPPVVPSGWSLAPNGSRAAGLGPAASDSGEVLVQWMYKIADGTETGNLSVSVPGGNGGRGRILRWTKSGSLSWSIQGCNGADLVPTLPWNVTSDQLLDLTTGDMVLAASGVNGDVGSGVGGEALSATGITFGGNIERGDGSNTTGDDMHAFMSHQSVSAGSGSVAVSYTATLGTSAAAFFPTGATVFLRLRETTLAAATGLAESTSETDGTLSVQSIGVGIAEDTSEATATFAAISTSVALAESTSETTGEFTATGVMAGVAESSSEATATIAVLIATEGIATSTSEATGIGISWGTFFPVGIAEDVSQAFGTGIVDVVLTSPMTGLTAVIGSFASDAGMSTFFVHRSSFGHREKGKWVKSDPALFPVVGFHHPIPRGAKLELGREGSRRSEVKAFYSNTELRTRTEINEPDLVMIDGEAWTVSAVEDWQAFGDRFWRAYISRTKSP